MKTIIVPTSLVLSLAILSSSLAVDLENWPGRSEKLGPPAIMYLPDGTCGDFARIPEHSPQVAFYNGWINGYISGVNSTRKYGGNVLGPNNPKMADFLMMVHRYCADHPLEPFVNGITVSLKKIQPVDWDRIGTGSNLRK
jgi:hypothetical protein